jgi:uncharacterized protein (DUF1810 family)
VGGEEELTADPYNLHRFADAQQTAYERALAEIQSGKKRSHWMWYIFPQMAGLGHSEMAQRYAIRSMDEARAYLAHPILGRRLRTWVAALQDLSGTTAAGVFGAVDAMKLKSSLTLFAEASGEILFRAALERWFIEGADEKTITLLGN